MGTVAFTKYVFLGILLTHLLSGAWTLGVLWEHRNNLHHFWKNYFRLSGFRRSLTRFAGAVSTILALLYLLDVAKRVPDRELLDAAIAHPLLSFLLLGGLLQLSRVGYERAIERVSMVEDICRIVRRTVWVDKLRRPASQLLLWAMAHRFPGQWGKVLGPLGAEWINSRLDSILKSYVESKVAQAAAIFATRTAVESSCRILLVLLSVYIANDDLGSLAR